MITGHKKYFIKRCVERGYSIHDAMPCVAYQDGDMWTVDETHPAYPAEKPTPLKLTGTALTTTGALHSQQVPSVQVSPETFKKIIALSKEKMAADSASAKEKNKKRVAATRLTAATRGGVGTELKKLLAKIGIKASPTCSCNKRAQIMDEKGIEWCKENIDMIVGWLREEATKRKLPFFDFAGKLLVQRASSLAEKAEKKRLAAQQQDQAQDG